MGDKPFQPRVPRGIYGNGNLPPGFVYEDCLSFFFKIIMKTMSLAKEIPEKGKSELIVKDVISKVRDLAFFVVASDTTL